MKKNILMGVGAKLVINIVAVVILLTILNVGVTTYFFKGNNEEIVTKNLDSDVILALGLFEKNLPGDWEAKGNTLLKGGIDIANSTITGQIAGLTGDQVTLFLGDVRVSTTLLQDNGTSAVGTSVKDNKPLVHKVLVQGKNFDTTITLFKEQYGARYLPIKDKDGKIIGMFFMGMPTKGLTGYAEKAQVWIIIIGVAFGLFAAVASGFAVKYIIRHMHSIEKIVHLAESGDLTVRAQTNSRDEIGRLGGIFNKMLESINNLVKGNIKVAELVTSNAHMLAKSSSEVAKITEEISNTTEQLSNGASSQAREAEVALTKATELASAMDNVHNQSEIMYKKSIDMKDSNEQGTSTLIVLKEKTLESSKAAEEISVTIHGLDECSRKIGVITESITAIAAQTNLLALNAAIEAARAGEQGKGFAVVADEIRKLAVQSSASASEIIQLVNEIQLETGKTVKGVSESQKITENQFFAVEDTLKAFNDISSQVDEIINSIGIVRGAFESVNTGKDALVASIQNITAVAQQSAAATEEVSASTEEQSSSVQELTACAQELDGLANRLISDIKRFKIN